MIQQIGIENNESFGTYTKAFRTRSHVKDNTCIFLRNKFLFKLKNVQYSHLSDFTFKVL